MKRQSVSHATQMVVSALPTQLRGCRALCRTYDARHERPNITGGFVRQRRRSRRLPGVAGPVRHWPRQGHPDRPALHRRPQRKPVCHATGLGADRGTDSGRPHRVPALLQPPVHQVPVRRQARRRPAAPSEAGPVQPLACRGSRVDAQRKRASAHEVHDRAGPSSARACGAGPARLRGVPAHRACTSTWWPTSGAARPGARLQPARACFRGLRLAVACDGVTGPSHE